MQEYFHVVGLVTRKQDTQPIIFHSLDNKDLESSYETILVPFVKGEILELDGYFFNTEDVERIKIYKTTNPATKNVERALEETGNNFKNTLTKWTSEHKVSDITSSTLREARKRTNLSNSGKTTQESKTKALSDNTKVFIVHGHDDLAKTELARFLEKLELDPIILHEQANSGKTIIEKIEEYSNVGYGVVLYTPCDHGAKKEEKTKPRARQNVVFEHGFLNGKLGRNRVAALVKDSVEIPNDISGLVYISMNGNWQTELAKDLKKAGYAIDMNKLI